MNASCKKKEEKGHKCVQVQKKERCTKSVSISCGCI